MGAEELTPGQVNLARKWLNQPWPLPYAFRFENTVAKILKLRKGGHSVWRLDRATGGWLREDMLVRRQMHDRDVSELSPAHFVDAVESARASWGLGEGRLRGLYDELLANVDEGSRVFRMGGQVRDLLVRRREIQLTTYRMFEDELRRRGDPAAQPELADVAEQDPNWP